MVEITYQMVLSTLQTIALIVGIYYYVMTLNYTRRNQEHTLRTRNATFFHQVIGQMLSNNEALKHAVHLQSNPFSSIEEYNELMKDPDYATATYYVRQLYEMLGVYVRNGIMDIEMFAQIQPYYQMRWWEMNKEQIYDSRERMFGPSYYRNVEYLMNAVQEYLKEHPEYTP